MTSGLRGAIPMPMRPFTPSGNPFPLISVHVFPASLDFQSADPTPPLFNEYGVRRFSHDAAYTTSGLRGSRATSMKPVRSFAPALILVQVAPPSVVLYIPPSGPAFHPGPGGAP